MLTHTNASSYQTATNARTNPVCLHGGQSENSALGSITKSCANVDFKELPAIQVKRAERYALQDEAVRLLPSERVRFCLKHRIDNAQGVEVMYNATREQAHYANVQRCGSVWTCPVCSAQISEGRRQELKQGLAHWKGQGGAVYLLTLTNPHHHGDNLKQLLEGQKKALHRLWTLRKSREMFETLGKVGHITATEVTHGSNGWHPHYHILLFFKNPINAKSLRGFLASAWQNCCSKSGLKVPSVNHGVDVRDGEYADKYISKWGLEDEVTKGHSKKGRDGNHTPWDLLRLSETGCELSGRLFQAFAESFKGKRQLSWSKGLKSLLLVDEVTDEELATETEKDSVQVKELPILLWDLIKRYKERAGYLKAIEHDLKYGSQRADNLIESLALRYVVDYREELLANSDMHEIRAKALEVSHV
ncbi:protein rep [uncultured Psychrobacter sp.]|uniref:protein rep n=1 Tax=uncultured Psychrobacter sp. TaxID=259303 RepID=UPI002617ACB5|nr:protein rep [uncultured Psychrobacter sp.]